MSKYFYICQPVYNRGNPPDSFLDQMIEWGRTAPEEIFALNNEPDDVMNLIRPALGPWQDIMHRRCALMETMRVLAGFESSWNWNEGVDVTNPSENNPETISAGAWQCSWNSRSFGQDLKDLAASKNIHDGDKFQAVTKSDHLFAMDWVSRLIRTTTKHHGPLKRHEVLPYLNRDAVSEFRTYIEADVFP
jgi:hypothetical protein